MTYDFKSTLTMDFLSEQPQVQRFVVDSGDDGTGLILLLMESIELF